MRERSILKQKSVIKKTFLIIIVFLFMLSFAGCEGQNSKNYKETSSKNIKQLSEREKIEDFKYMYKILKENYPFFEVNKRLNNIDWLSKKDEYIQRVKDSKNDDEFYHALESILEELNNGHTDMVDKSLYLYMRDVYEPLGKITEPWTKELKKEKVISRYLGNGDKELSSTKDGAGQYIEPNNIKTAIIEEGSVGYLHIKSFNTFNIEGDMKTIKPFLQSIKNYKVLIIDIRGNGGGDSRYWSDNLVPMLINKPIKNIEICAYRGGKFSEDFIKTMNEYEHKILIPIKNIENEGLKNMPLELKKDFKYYSKNEEIINPKDSINFKGKIYLLVNGRVYSSAEKFATFAKSTGFATLIGEKTGGDGIGSDPLVCALPNSGYVFKFSCNMGLTSDGTCNEEFKTEPDFIAPPMIDQNLLNDKCVKKVLELEKIKR